MKKVKIAMLGFGGIAKSHKKAYEILIAKNAPVELVAICDIDQNQFTKVIETNLGEPGHIDLSGINLYTDLDEMLEKEEIDMVDICLPSYLHCEYTCKMLRAGKHVQCEKPMALNSDDCELMIKTAKECGKRLMIGQCLRFEPQYLFVKKCIEEETFGKLRYAQFDRMSPLPRWGFNKWFQKTECSGGCAMDLHIHDVDMVRFLLGEPEAVSAIAYDDRTRWQYINSRFFFGDSKVITATGSWDEARTKKFAAGFNIRFDKANIKLEGGKVMVYPMEGEVYEAQYEAKNRMAEELLTIAMLILDPESENLTNPPESAAASVALVEKLCRSADNCGDIIR